MAAATLATAFVLVRNPFTGDACELGELPLECRVSMLKEELKERWQVSPLCQQLVLRGRLLANSEALADLRGAAQEGEEEEQGAPRLELDMVVSKEVCIKHTLQALVLENRAEVLGALRNLQRWPLIGNVEIVLAVVRLISREVIDGAVCCGCDSQLLSEALTTLPCIIEQGDDAAVGVIRAELLRRTGRNWRERVAAALALGRVAAKGDEATIRALTVRLGDKEHEVRIAAADALGKLTPLAGSEETTAALRSQVESAFFRVFGYHPHEMTEEGYKAVFDRLLEDADPDVRCEAAGEGLVAVEALRHIAGKARKPERTQSNGSRLCCHV